MTISTTTNRVRYEGNGATTSFSYSFRIDDEDEVTVTIVDDEGTETELTAGQYSITGIGEDTGGAVTYPLVGSPLAANNAIVIVREVPLTQPTDLTNQGAFYPEVIETALDRLTMLVQQLQTLLDRTIRFPVTDPAGVAVLETALARANKYLQFDANGDVSYVDSQVETIYYGASATEPTTRPDSSAREAGDLYFNSTSNMLFVFDGSNWRATTATVTHTVQNFTGTGAQTAFTLNADPVSENNLDVFIEGVFQHHSTFSVSGTTLTFSTAPPNGYAIEVRSASIDNSLGYVSQVSLSGNTTLTSAHVGKELLLDPGGGTLTLTVPNSIAAGAKIILTQTGTGTVTIVAGSGASRENSSSSYSLYGQYSVGLLSVASNTTGTNAEWIFSGDVA